MKFKRKLSNTPKANLTAKNSSTEATIDKSYIDMITPLVHRAKEDDGFREIEEILEKYGLSN